MTINQAAAVGALKQTKSQLPESKKEKNPMYQKTCYGFLNQGVFETAHRLPSWVCSEVLNTEAALITQLLLGEHVEIFDGIIDALLLQKALDPPPLKKQMLFGKSQIYNVLYNMYNTCIILLSYNYFCFFQTHFKNHNKC